MFTFQSFLPCILNLKIVGNEVWYQIPYDIAASPSTLQHLYGTANLTHVDTVFPVTVMTTKYPETFLRILELIFTFRLWATTGLLK